MPLAHSPGSVTSTDLFSIARRIQVSAEKPLGHLRLTVFGSISPMDLSVALFVGRCCSRNTLWPITFLPSLEAIFIFRRVRLGANINLPALNLPETPSGLEARRYGRRSSVRFRQTLAP